MDTMIGAPCPACGAISGMCRCGVVEENIQLKKRVAHLEMWSKRLKDDLVATMDRERTASDGFKAAIKSFVDEVSRLSKRCIAMHESQKPRSMDEEPGEGVWVWTVKRYRFGSRPESPEITNWYDAEDYQMHGDVEGWIPCYTDPEEVG